MEIYAVRAGRDKNKSDSIGIFTTTEVRNISTSLIREGIQNSLDEWVDRSKEKKERKPVRIAVFHSGNKYALKPSEYKEYISGLENSLKS